MDIRTAIRSRRSTRRYVGRPVAGGVLEHLLAFAAAVDHLSRPGVRVALVSGRERVARILTRYAGIYGLVQGVPHLLMGLLPQDTDQARLDLGYVLEQVVLEATRQGLATCWMTGSYHRDRAVGEVEMNRGEVLGAVVAVGHPRRDPLARVHDGVVRRLVSAHRRRPLEELVFSGRWGEPWSLAGAELTLAEVLECARRAPSACNRQPWRFVVGEGELHLALIEPAPIDAGIVMAHVALAAVDLGLPGRWALRWGDPAMATVLRLPPSVVPVATLSSHEWSESRG
ncbi:MAG TPA: hypothetical protein ENI37_05645 [Chloroflexi bacterium]|nr:hypothetical protein [Chloroflexota bacterium]